MYLSNCLGWELTLYLIEGGIFTGTYESLKVVVDFPKMLFLSSFEIKYLCRFFHGSLPYLLSQNIVLLDFPSLEMAFEIINSISQYFNY